MLEMYTQVATDSAARTLGVIKLMPHLTYKIYLPNSAIDLLVMQQVPTIEIRDEKVWDNCGYR